MKTKTTITDITQEDLVNLLSTATCSSDWLGIRRKKGTYKGTELEDEEDCLEDTWAKVLLAGKALSAYDFYAEDEEDFYGNLPHEWSKEKQAMRYDLTLKDIEKGLIKCLDKLGDYERGCVTRYIDCENSDFDAADAEDIMQVVLFGKIIYG